MKVKFYLLRPNSKTDTGILASISFKNERLRIGVDECINPKYWNPITKRARNTPSFPSSLEFNTRLDFIKSGIERCYYDYCNQNNQPPTTRALKAMILKDVLNKQKRISFLEFYQDFILRTESGSRISRKGAVINPEAAKFYRTALGRLKEFNPNLNYNDVTTEFYNEYLKFLNKKGLALNTIGDQIKKIKAVMEDALKAGHHRNEDYKSFIKPTEEAENVYLSTQELADLEKLDLSFNPSYDKVRDLFLIGCHTGLRMSDFSRLTSDHIKEGFITIEQKKTKHNVVIPVHSVVKKILKKYNGDLPSAISGQKFNEYLKEISKKVPALRGNESKRQTRGGFKTITTLHKWEMISSHTARRSFCTNEYLKGTPALTIMKVSGHKTESSFLKYIKISSKEHAEKMKQLWEERESKLKVV